MMLSLTVLVPVLAGFALILSLPNRRGELAMAAGLVLALTALLGLLAIATGDTLAVRWSEELSLSARLTPVSAVMLLLPPLVAIPVVVRGALSEAEGLPRLVGLLVVFVGGMEIVVMAGDLITLLIGWEVIGAASWALVAHHWKTGAAVTSGIWAFLVTRAGDLGLFLAVMATFVATGSVRFEALGELSGATLALVSAGLVVSAAAKAAQLPFSPWLFRAMDGPTPVSALLHSATLVAAGAYLVIRLGPFLGEGFAAAAIGFGLLTALGGGLVALLNVHAKRLLAGSTAAHLGLMFVAAGAGYPGVALAHLIAHAAMKSVLFIEAGTAHTLRETYALDRLRIGNAAPALAWLSLLPALALAGVPPLGAGWTKEEIVGAAEGVSPLLAFGVVLAGGLSAAYAMRFFVSVFSPGPEVPAARIPSRATMLVPSAALTAVTVALSVLWFHSIVDRVAHALRVGLPPGSLTLFVLSMVAIAAGLALGIAIARRAPALGQGDLAARLADWFGLHWLMEHALARPAGALARALARVDDAALDAVPRAVRRASGDVPRVLAAVDDAVVDALPRAVRRASGDVPRALAVVDDAVVDRGVALAAALSRWLARLGDRFGERATDGLPSGTAFLVGVAGADLRRLQTGLTHHYYVILAAGLAAAIAILAIGA